MPIYEYVCSANHVTERVYRMNDERPKTVKCCERTCRRRARRSFHHSPFVMDDFPEHFNVSMGCLVKNRAHHRALQKKMGLKDWEPVKESPLSERMRREGLI